MARRFKELRMVCMQCPAVAKVHMQTNDFHRDALVVWAECHDVHRFGWIDAEKIMAGERRGGVTFDDVATYEPQHLQNMLEETEARMLRDGKLHDVITRYLKGALQ